MNTVVDKNTVIQQDLNKKKLKKLSTNHLLENISMENAAYLQNIENDS